MPAARLRRLRLLQSCRRLLLLHLQSLQRRLHASEALAIRGGLQPKRRRLRIRRKPFGLSESGSQRRLPFDEMLSTHALAAAAAHATSLYGADYGA